MASVYDNIFTRMARKEWVTPYLENAVLADSWPDSYTVTIDSSPYYGAGDGYFHPSSHPLMGARQLFYLFHPDYQDRIVHEKRSLTSQMALAMGSALHGVVQTQFQMAGLVGPDDVEVEFVNKEHWVRGRADFIFDHPNGERLPIEFKTMNSRQFGYQEQPKPAWEAQLNLAMDTLGYPFGIVLVMESGFPYRFKEFPIRRNDELLSQIYGKFDSVREAIELGIPPAHCCALGSQEMKSCVARFNCWMAEENG